jgi:hypothetical protein
MSGHARRKEGPLAGSELATPQPVVRFRCILSALPEIGSIYR